MNAFLIKHTFMQSSVRFQVTDFFVLLLHLRVRNLLCYFDLLSLECYTGGSRTYFYRIGAGVCSCLRICRVSTSDS